LGPLEADSPLVVDPDAVLTFASALQHFKPVSRQHGYVFQGCGCIEPIKLQPGGVFNATERRHPRALRKICRASVRITDDHKQNL